MSTKNVRRSTGRRSSRKIKKRIIRPTKLPKNAKIAILVSFLLILLLCLINMGILVTIFVAFCGLVILGIARLLDNLNRNSKKRKILNAVLILALIFGILSIILFGVFMIYITINAPKFDKSKLNKNEVTIIYDKDGNKIAKLGSEFREKITYEELPQSLVDAIIATEDSRFFQHNGFDAPRFLRASLGQIAGQDEAGGASTLSMQVIKNSFTSTVSGGIKGIIRKFTDIYLAIFKLEKNYSKEEIIEFYVNNHFLGGNIYGVQEASREYFGKDVSELNLAEASVLAGMFKSPNYYRPNVNPKNATARRKTVLYLMQKHGYITKEERELALSIPVESLTTEHSIATTSEYQSYIDTVVDEVEEKYGVNAYVAPLLIYTNMDKDKQNAVNDVLNGVTYNWINDKVQTGVSVLDTQTGKILAVGGGRFKSGANTFNYATQINRQPGSTAKPLFDYGPGIEYENWSTYTLFDDSPHTYSGGRAIHNWDRGYYGTITLRRALSASRNIPALKAFQQIVADKENGGKEKIVDFVTSLGLSPEIYYCKDGYKLKKNKCISTKNPDKIIDAEINIDNLHEAHSIGAFTGVSPLEMSAAYAAFSNGGYYNEPYSVSKIVFRDTGKTIEHKENPKQVMSDATAFMISSVLQDVAITGGKPNNVAAKTGTTNYDAATMAAHGLPDDAIRDSWVIGYTTKTIIGMWYGYDFIDSEYCLRNLPATIQKDKLFLALANTVFEKNKEEFKMPDSVVKLGIITGSNPPQIAPEGYGGDITYEYFKKGHEPDGSSAATSKLATPGNLKATYSGGKVTISWSGVSRLENDDKYGTFGYNIYQGNTLLDFTESTSYTFTTSNPYNTYRVVATYKSYSGAQSEAASYKLEEEKVTATIACNDINNYAVGDPLPDGSSCQAKINGSAISATVTVKDSSNCGTTVFDDKTSCTIVYQFTHNNVVYSNKDNPTTYTLSQNSVIP